MVGIIGVAFFFLGILLMLIAGIWGTVLAFQEDVVWGLLYVFVPFAAIVFVVKKWSKKAVRNSFFLGILGFVSMLGGFVISSVRLNSFVERQEQAPIGSGDEPFPIGDSSEAEPTQDTPETESTPQSSESSNDPSVNPSVAPDSQPESATDPQAAESPAAQSETPADAYHDTMMLGYRAYEQGDYQTALINFRRALEMKPGDQLALDAIENTESAIAAN